LRSGTLLAFLSLLPTVSFAGTLSFSGVFPGDDYIQFFTYSVQNTALVTVSTTSYATGGFEPILSLFDSSGNFQNGDSGYAGNRDATLSWVSTAGARYTIALTEYDNFPLGTTLAEGFSETGNGNFTAKLPFNNPVPGGKFLLPGGRQLTGNWSITFTSAEPTLTASAVPEPGSLVLLLAGCAGMLACRGALRKSRG